MAEEEFLESEVIFSDYEEAVSDDGYLDFRGFSKNGIVSRNNSNNIINSKSKKSFPKKKKKMSSSVPINIPRYGDNLFHCGGADDFEEEEEEGGIVPPHLILARRIAGKMAFSVCTGNGRTLKGRDLSQVRNSILRMTGFLEA